MLFDQGTEMEEGGVDVSHGRQIMGLHRVVEAVGLGHVIALQKVMVGIQEFYHLLHKRPVSGGLEGTGFKIFVIVLYGIAEVKSPATASGKVCLTFD